MPGGARSNVEGFIDRSRLRQEINLHPYQRRPVVGTRARVISDFSIAASQKQNLSPVPAPVMHKVVQANARPQRETAVSIESPVTRNATKTEQLQTSHVVHHHNRKHNFYNSIPSLKTRAGLQVVIVACAVILVAVGGFASLDAWKTNKVALEQARKLTQQANQAAAVGAASDTASTTNQTPSTIKPSSKAITSYAVAPNLPKYLKIPAIGVDARVLQVGVLASGALGTPDNVYDTAWYTGSAEPGQPGATLIDGHVSSWTTDGVFYNLHKLKAGNTIQIVKGNNSVVNYTVVKTQVFNSNNVDMQAAITPVTPGISGLNLITCTGQVIKGTSQFNERVIVFAQETS